MSVRNKVYASFLVFFGLALISQSRNLSSMSLADFGCLSNQVDVVFQLGSGLAFDPELDAVWCDEIDKYHLSSLPLFATSSYPESNQALESLLEKEELNRMFSEQIANSTKLRKDAVRFAIFAFSDLYETEDSFCHFFFATNAIAVKQDENWQIGCILDKLGSFGFFDHSPTNTQKTCEENNISIRIGDKTSPFVVSLRRHWVGPNCCVLLPDDIVVSKSEETQYSRSPVRSVYRILPSSVLSTGKVRFNGKRYSTYLIPDNRPRELNDIQFVEELVRLRHVRAIKCLLENPCNNCFFEKIHLHSGDIDLLRKIALVEMSRYRFWDDVLSEYFYGCDKSLLPTNDREQIDKLIACCFSKMADIREFRGTQSWKHKISISEDTCCIDFFNIDEGVNYLVWSIRLKKHWIDTKMFLWVISEFGDLPVF